MTDKALQYNLYGNEWIPQRSDVNGNLHVTLENSATDEPLLTDDLTGALAAIDVVHHEIHEGEYFFTEYSASVNNAASLQIRILTGADGLHFDSDIGVGGQCQLYLYEAATISLGTPLVIYNRKRNDVTHTAPFQAWHTPTVGATGTTALIPGRLVPGGSSNQTRIGGFGGQRKEWILLPNTEYLLRITNTSGAAVVISATVEGYAF